MRSIGLLPFWLLMAAIAIPLVMVSLAAIGSYASSSNDPVVFSYIKVLFGPISVTTNGRPWAGICILIGILLLTIGLVGLLHFPTERSLSINQVELTSDATNEDCG